MGRSHHRRKSGTDINQLLNLPDTRGPQDDSASTGRFDVDMKALLAQERKLRELLGQIQSAIGEGHGLLKDLRVETRQARRMIPMIVSKRINTEVEKQLDELSGATQRAMDASVAKVGREFERLESVFLGTDREGRREGKSIPEIAEIAQADPELMEHIRGRMPHEQNTSGANGRGESTRTGGQ